MDLKPLFGLMAERGASDLFITAGAAIQIKINNITMPVNQQVMNAAQTRQIAEMLMTPERQADFERDLEMNFGYPIEGLGNYRVNIFKQRGNVALVVRYIKPRAPSFDELRLPSLIKDLTEEKRGLILVVGATGSGKSSTLAAMIEHRNQLRSGHILTVEDPIEFHFQHAKCMVNQREIGIDTHSYLDALKNAMREAPEMLMIGEIRDKDTMQYAVNYAQAGHLCLSTLHGNNSYHVLNRIINFFPHDARNALLLDLSVALRAIISQRLVRDKQGRLIPVVETLMNSNRIAELIKTGNLDEIKTAMEQSLYQGSQTFEQHLFRLVKDGTISLDDAMANSDSQTNLSWLLNNDNVSHKKLEEKETNVKQSFDPEATMSKFVFDLKVDDDAFDDEDA